MIRHKKPAAIWLAKSEGRFSCYQLGLRKKDWNGQDFDPDNIVSFCDDDFERVTGIKLERGEIVRVRISVEDRHPGSW